MRSLRTLPAWQGAGPGAGRGITTGPYVILGCDPGATTGLCLLGAGEPLAFQCNAPAACSLAQFLLEASEGPATLIAAGERFVPGTGAGGRRGGAAVTRALIGDLATLPVSWHWRSAADVKPWASDRRLERAGLLAPCHGMGHAADAMRHALFAAVHDAGWPDPLGREGGAWWRGGGQA